ncbi:MAG: hypothetical protein GX055_05230 [Desulfovibrionales bacterium]|nr:hypothetical protein [Desulfovibrionales bacterium]
MGRVLQVRVLAYTYDEQDVRTTWPVLWQWAFEETRPGFPHDKKGVLELVRAIDEMCRFQDIPEHVRIVLEPALPELLTAVESLQYFLGEWNAHKANEATDAIEDALGALEQRIPKP